MQQHQHQRIVASDADILCHLICGHLHIVHHPDTFRPFLHDHRTKQLYDMPDTISDYMTMIYQARLRNPTK